MSVQPIPEGYSSLTAYLTVHDGKGAIEFYKRAFGAAERGAMTTPDGRIAHAELSIGDAVLMLSDKLPEFAGETPKDLGGTTVTLFHYVEDVDRAVRTAAAAGAEVTMQPENQFWGDRMGQVKDPYGHVWVIAARVEDLTADEIDARARELFAAAG